MAHPSKPARGKPRAQATKTSVWHFLVLGAVTALLFVLYLATELRRNSQIGFPLDDPWIHLTFARNLAHGWGFVFNQGHWVAGSSAPLWTIVLAFFHLFTSSATVMVLIVKLLDAAFLVVAAGYALLIASRLSHNRWAGLSAGLAVVSLWPMGWAMMSGMEVTLSVALTLAGIYYYLVPGPGWKAYVPWVLFGLAVYTRPECLALPVLAALDGLLQRWAFNQRRMVWRGLGAWFVTALPYFVFNLALTGSPFPQTFTAKVGPVSAFAVLQSGDAAAIVRLVAGRWPAYVAQYVTFLWRVNPMLTLLLPTGLVGLVMNTFRHSKNDGFLVPLVILGYVPLMGVAAPVFQPAFQSGRYVGNVTALAAVASVLGILFLGALMRGRAVRAAFTGLLASLLVFNAVSLAIAHARNTARATSSINRMQVYLGHWLADNTPTAATLACNDIGAIGYFSHRRIIDLAGLITRDILRYRFMPGGRGRFIVDTKPDFLVIFPEAFPELEGAPFLDTIKVVEVPDNTASLYDVVPRLRTWARVLVLDEFMESVPVATVVYRCNWNALPR